MALELSSVGDLRGSSRTSLAADPSDDTNELSEHVFNELTSNISKCEYVDLRNNDNLSTNEPDSLILMHLNIRSLNKYYNDLHTLLNSLPLKPNVIALSKSRINQPTENIDINGNEFVHVTPNYGQAGGVTVYISV